MISQENIFARLYFEEKSNSASAALSAAFLLTRFLEVSSVAKLLEGSFLVELLFQTAKSTVNRLAFFQSDFRSFHSVHPPSLPS